MISRNTAEADANSLAAVNNGSGNQTLVNNSTVHIGGLVNLTSTVTGAIVFDPKAMREVILSIDKVFGGISASPSDFDIIDIEEKNKLNGLTQEFYDEEIAVEYEPFFIELDVFLKQRVNQDLLKSIDNIVSNLNRKILIKRKKFDSFEELLLSIEEALLDKEYSLLNGKENTICFFLFYLYASCLIGKKTEREKAC